MKTRFKQSYDDQKTRKKKNYFTNKKISSSSTFPSTLNNIQPIYRRISDDEFDKQFIKKYSNQSIKSSSWMNDFKKFISEDKQRALDFLQECIETIIDETKDTERTNMES